jgi:hypothetical protein
VRGRCAGACCCVALVVACATAIPKEPGRYSDQEFDPDYEKVLLANTVLMEAGGIDTLVLKDGTEVLIGVSQVVIKPGATPADMLKSRRVAELKAAATVSQFLQTDISTVSELVKKTTVQSEQVDGELQSRARRVERFLSTHIETRSQLRARMKRVGSWRSADGQYLHAAMAVAPVE